ncbi:unnamed protein product [Sphagnum balticum]
MEALLHGKIVVGKKLLYELSQPTTNDKFEQLLSQCGRAVAVQRVVLLLLFEMQQRGYLNIQVQGIKVNPKETSLPDPLVL